MGIFGFMRDIVSAPFKVVKKVASCVKDAVVTAKDWLKDKYNKFTGKDMADKAKQIYEASRKKYEDASSKYKKEVDKYSNNIKKHIINHIEKFLFYAIIQENRIL